MAGLVIRNGKLLLDAAGGIVVRPDPTWNVATALSPLLVAAPEGQAGAIAQFTATGGLPGSYTYSAVDALPSGLSLSSSGTLSGDGTEKATAVADYTVRVTNAAGSTDFTVSIEIRASGAQAISYVDLVNEDAANPSSGFGYFAQPFVDGDVPSGKVPKLRRQSTGTVYDVQVSQRKMFASGALEWGTICYRVPDIAAGATERYEIVAVSGSYDDTPRLTLSDLNASADRDFKVEISDRELNSYTIGGATSDVLGDEDWGQTGVTNYIQQSERRYHAAGGTSVTLYPNTFGSIEWATYPAAGAGNITVTPSGCTINGSSSPFICSQYTTWKKTSGTTDFVTTVPTNPVTQAADVSCAFNTISSVSTRVTEQMAGPICYMIRAWGMFGSDENLKGEFFVAAFDDGAGGIAGWQFMPIMKLDWRIDNALNLGQTKQRQLYQAVIKDGDTVLAEFNSNNWPLVQAMRVEHYYRSWWGGCDRTDDDVRHGQPHWIAGTKSRPTHWHKRDFPYLVTTGKLPPFKEGIGVHTYTQDDIVLNGSSVHAEINYRPCTSQSHRPAMGNAGGYPGRGFVSAMDVQYLTNQTPQRFRVALLANWAGVHAPVHVADERTRTRPGDGSADVGNTLIPLLLDRDDFSDSPSRWHSVGLADAVYFATWNYQGNLSFTDAVGGSGHWTIEHGAAHCVQYSYNMALLTGHPWFIDSCISNTFYAHTNTNFNSSGHHPPLFLSSYTGAPTTPWSAIAYNAGSERGVAWPFMMLGTAAAVTPDADPRSGFVKAHAAHVALYWVRSLCYYPQGLIDAGEVFFNTAAGGGAVADFSFHQWQASMGYFAYQLTGIDDFKTIGAQAAKLPISMMKLRGLATCWTYRCCSRAVSPGWTVETPVYVPVCSFAESSTGGIQVDSSNNRFFGTDPHGKYPFSNGDRIRWSDYNSSHGIVPTPTGFSLATDYYVVNAAGDGYFQLSETPDGAPIDFGTSTFAEFQCHEMQSVLNSVVAGENGTQALGAIDVTPPMVWAVCVMAERHGHPDADSTFMDAFEAYMGPWLGLADYGTNSWWRVER